MLHAQCITVTYTSLLAIPGCLQNSLMTSKDDMILHTKGLSMHKMYLHLMQIRAHSSSRRSASRSIPGDFFLDSIRQTQLLPDLQRHVLHKKSFTAL